VLAWPGQSAPLKHDSDLATRIGTNSSIVRSRPR
jgi:hypothetical protein